MTSDQKLKFKDHLLNDFQESLYSMQVEQGFDIKRLQAILEDTRVADYDTQIAKLKARLAEIDSIGKKEKTNDQKREYKRIELEIQGIEFKKTAITTPKDKLYKEIDQRSRKMESVQEMISYIESFDFDKVPQLPHFEIDGTILEAKNNKIVRDDMGVGVLKMNPKKKNDVANNAA